MHAPHKYLMNAAALIIKPIVQLKDPIMHLSMTVTFVHETGALQRQFFWHDHIIRHTDTEERNLEPVFAHIDTWSI